MKQYVDKGLRKLALKLYTHYFPEVRDHLWCKSYAQEGEDILLNRFIGPKTDGFYIDVGAHHPMRFSNTYLYYTEGWRGVAIDPLPECKEEYELHRPRDTFVNKGVSGSPGKLTYYMFDEAAMNTFDGALAETRVAEGWKRKGEMTIECLPLVDILSDAVPEGQAIDFMSVDVEGLDLQVLQSNNWERYRPRFLVVEDLSVKPGDTEISAYLNSLGYVQRSRLCRSSLFEWPGK